MLNWWDNAAVINKINSILDEMFIEPITENREQIQGIIENYLEQEYPDVREFFNVDEILEEVIGNE